MDEHHETMSYENFEKWCVEQWIHLIGNDIIASLTQVIEPPKFWLVLPSTAWQVKTNMQKVLKPAIRKTRKKRLILVFS